MHDDDPETLERLLMWIYQLQYPVLPEQRRSATPWTEDLMLYMMADKYGLSALTDATRQTLMQRASQCLDRPETLVASISDLVEALQMLFADLPERGDLIALRSDLLNSISPVLATQMRSTPDLEQLMTTTPGFGIALVESLAQQSSDRRRSSASSVSLSVGSGISKSGSASPRYVKPYIPLNEDSEDELD